MPPTSWPAERVIKAAQDGDVASLAAVISGSHPHVRRFAGSLCASPQDAEDAAQEALIILYRKIGTLRATSALAAWMFRIVRNECLRRLKRALPGSSAPPSEPVAPPTEDIVLHEVARALGLSTAAMKSRLHRARTGVRKALERS
jgi:RNA polymerase sigma-70 factor (ECF subfamily)